MSVLVDTNVVSELIGRSPDPAVGDWAAAHHLEDPFFSAVGEAELRYGAAILAAGRRRDTLIADIEWFLQRGQRQDRLPRSSPQGGCRHDKRRKVQGMRDRTHPPVDGNGGTTTQSWAVGDQARRPSVNVQAHDEIRAKASAAA